MKTLFTRSLAIVSILSLSLFAAYNGEYDSRLNNYAMGKQLYNDATITRSANAALYLGDLYIERIKDYEKALYWYKKGYEFGDRIAAAHGIGMIYADYLKDYTNAIKWYKIAYDEGIIYGAYGVAITYGEDLKDYPNAIKWYEIAHKGGDKDAAYALGLLYSTKLKDYENAKKWYKIAYNQGDYRGIQSLGVLYHDQYNDKITAGAYYLGLIGKYSKDEVISVLKSDWNFTTDELKQAYKLHQTLDLPSRYRYKGGID